MNYIIPKSKILLLLANIGTYLSCIIFYEQLFNIIDINNLPYCCIKIIILSILNSTINFKLLSYITTVVKNYITLSYKNLILNSNKVDIWKNTTSYENLLTNTFIKLPKIITFMCYFYCTVSDNSLKVVTSLSTVLFIYLSCYLSRIHNKFKSKSMHYENNVKNIILESSSNIDHIKLNNNINKEAEKLCVVYDQYKKYKLRDIFMSHTFTTIFILINVMVNGYLVYKNNNFSTLLYVNIYYYYLYKFKNIKLPLNKVINIYKEQNNNTSELPICDNICYNNISYSYDSISNIVNDISFIIEKNKINILLGENGCGKTTLIKLLLKLLDIQTGSITINEKNLAEYSISNICYIPDDPIIFNDTVHNNIIYGINEEKETDILYWCDFLELTLWYHTNKNVITGYKGNSISKGDKKKIQLLNALCKNPKIIIFDEPSTTLDNNAIKWFTNLAVTLNKLDKTIIICTHDKRLLSIDSKIIYIS